MRYSAYSDELAFLFDDIYAYEEISGDRKLFQKRIGEIKRMATDASLIFSEDDDGDCGNYNAMNILSELKPPGGLECLASLLFLDSDRVNEYLPEFLESFSFAELHKVFDQYLDLHEKELSLDALEMIVGTICSLGKKKSNLVNCAGFLVSRISPETSPRLMALIAKGLVELKFDRVFGLLFTIFQAEAIDQQIYPLNQYLFDLHTFVLENPNATKVKDVIRSIEDFIAPMVMEVKSATKKQLDKFLPLETEFHDIEFFDSLSVLQRTILTNLYAALGPAEFRSLTAELNRLARSQAIALCNHGTFMYFVEQVEEVEGFFYFEKLAIALEDLDLKPFDERFTKTPDDEQAFFNTVTVFHSLAAIKLEESRRDWMFLATVAHWSLQNRIGKNRFYRNAADKLPLIKSFYQSLGEKGVAALGKNSKLFSAMLEVLSAEILIIIHELARPDKLQEMGADIFSSLFEMPDGFAENSFFSEPPGFNSEPPNFNVGPTAQDFENIRDLMPAHEEFYRIDGFDDSNMIHRAMLNLLRREMNEAEFDDFTDKINRINKCEEIKQLNKIVRDAARSDYDQPLFYKMLVGALASLDQSPLGFKLKPEEEQTARMNADFVYVFARAEGVPADHNWHFIASLAHWRLHRRMVQKKTTKEFKEIENVFQSLYRGCLETGKPGRIKLPHKKERHLWRKINGVLLTEILLTAHKLKGTPRDYGFAPDSDVFPEIFE